MEKAMNVAANTVLFGMLLTTCFLGYACEASVPSQLRMDQHNQIVLDAFPALSSDGEKVALLVVPEPLSEATSLEVRVVTTGALVREYVLIPRRGDFNRESIEAATVEPNSYLQAGGFAAMEPLFTPENLSRRPIPSPQTYEQTHAELHVSVNYETNVVNVSVAASGKTLLHKKPATHTVPGYPDVCAAGTFEGTAHAGWIDRARSVVVVKYLFSFNDSCDQPEIWHVVRLDAAK